MIVDFLAMRHSPHELHVALRLLRAFKECESREEWAATPFTAWGKLEQFEEFLDHLSNGTPLKDDTREHLERHGKAQSYSNTDQKGSAHE